MNGFIIIPDEIFELGFKANTAIVMALIHTHSQREEGCFYGTLEKTSARINVSRKNLIEILKRLVEAGYLTREDCIIKGHQRVCYFVNYETLPRLRNVTAPSNETLPNNIINNITTPSTTRTREEFDFYGFFRDLGADDQSLKDWKEVRRKKGGINTKSAADAIIKEINRSGKSVRECIAKSASSSWCGFKWAWWQRELDEESGNNMRRNENQRVNDRRRGTPPSHPATAEAWGFGDRQKKK